MLAGAVPHGTSCLMLILFSQKKLQEASLMSEQNLKDTEKELRYVVRYIKVSFIHLFLFFPLISCG